MYKSRVSQNNLNFNWKQDIVDFLPLRMREPIRALGTEKSGTIEEIRIRVNQPVQATGRGWQCFFDERGDTPDLQKAFIATQQECQNILDAIAFHSVYALQEQLKRGYITLPKGYRVGICGRAIMTNGEIERLTDCMYFNFRIAREVLNCAKLILPHLQHEKTLNIKSTLILSAPNCGKTTLLRDIARQIANGTLGEGQKVCIADERGEIAGCHNGVAQNNIGLYSDVIDGCSKAQAMELLIRSMSPTVIITDEIGTAEDARALQHAANSGVALIATAHARDIADISRRPMLKAIFEHHIFDQFIVLSRRNGPGTLEAVYDSHLQKCLAFSLSATKNYDVNPCSILGQANK